MTYARGLIDPRKGRVMGSDGVWSQAILLGDCVEILLGRQVRIPGDLTSFLEDCVCQAIEQEIPVKDRHALAVVLGRVGDPRVALDLRRTDHPDEHPGYVKIPAGTYYCGDAKEAFAIHEPFWLSRFPVTNSQYALFIEDGGYAKQELWSRDGWQRIREGNIAMPRYWHDPAFNMPNQPVVAVSYWEGEAFCRWVGGRLPSEWEWEAAVRGPDGRRFPWGNEWEEGICNSEEIGLGTTSAVGIFPRSRSSDFLLEDMAGNVLEWCRDQIDDDHRVFRGGCWRHNAQYCLATFRLKGDPMIRNNDLGFRVAVDLLGPGS
jgi:formylglycine-generating enzyme required for sulfatase activity